MTRTFFLAISMLPVSAYAQTGAASDWTGYYMLTTVRTAKRWAKPATPASDTADE